MILIKIKLPIKNRSIFLACTVLVVLVLSCSATNRLTMESTKPVVVHLSSKVRSIGINDRSAPSKENEPLDKILSAEGLNLDKKGAEAAISSLVSEFSVIKSFEKIMIIESVEESKKGLAAMPASLSRELVERLCEENQVDVILFLAFYDPDTKADYRITATKLTSSLGIDVDVPAQEVAMATNIVNG